MIIIFDAFKIKIYQTFNIIKQMKTDLLETNSFFIDEKVNFFKFENAYQIYNDQGHIIGYVKQKLTSGQKMLRLILSKTMLPFLIEIRNADDELEATIIRGWTFLISRVNVLDALGNDIGTIQQQFKLIKPTLNVFNSTGTLNAKITGDWKGWNFVINNISGSQIGIITKKWNGVMKEIFTTADKYNLTVDPIYSSKEHKIVLLASAISIDMIFKEKE